MASACYAGMWIVGMISCDCKRLSIVSFVLMSASASPVGVHAQASCAVMSDGGCGDAHVEAKTYGGMRGPVAVVCPEHVPEGMQVSSLWRSASQQEQCSTRWHEMVQHNHK